MAMACFETEAVLVGMFHISSKESLDIVKPEQVIFSWLFVANHYRCAHFKEPIRTRGKYMTSTKLAKRGKKRLRTRRDWFGFEAWC